ncbi:DUF2017 family protein [Micrococcus sp.]|uniref:DUF2017 family protein n=1 Tax=Micrococcus sp. TaxID=1271 RepID=UPI0026DADF13|nr:DUF2017 family protein [Micrococcus sp.]MDO4240252.1 DUF2017 family protein [Micrococcus sp.]
MAQRFRWTRRGYVAELEKAEVRLLRGLVKDVVTLLENRQDEVLPETPGAVAEASGADAAARPSDADGDDAAFWALVGGMDLGAGAPEERPAPQDPAVARLLPDAMPHADEHERARQRALTEDALTAAKLDDARRALQALRSTRVTVPHEQAVSFGRALNDVRLVLATRLGIETDEDARRVHAVDDWRHAQDVEATMALLYNFTTWLQETLMDEMVSELPEDPPDEGAEGAGA